MPQPSKGPRLFKRKRKGEGRSHLWIIKDGGKRISTGVPAKSTEHRPPVAAEKALEAYLAQKNAPERKLRDIDQIPISDVLSIYYDDRVGEFQEEIQKRRFISRIKRLTVYFGKHMLGDMTTNLTQGYEKTLCFAHEVEFFFPFCNKGPIRVVRSDRGVDFEPRRKLDEKLDVLVVVEVARELLFNLRIINVKRPAEHQHPQKIEISTTPADGDRPLHQQGSVEV